MEEFIESGIFETNVFTGALDLDQIFNESAFQIHLITFIYRLITLNDNYNNRNTAVFEPENDPRAIPFHKFKPFLTFFLDSVKRGITALVNYENMANPDLAEAEYVLFLYEILLGLFVMLHWSQLAPHP